MRIVPSVLLISGVRGVKQTTYHPTLPRQVIESVVRLPGGMATSVSPFHVKTGRWIASHSSSYALSPVDSPSASMAAAARDAESSKESLTKSTGVDEEFSRVILMVDLA